MTGGVPDCWRPLCAAGRRFGGNKLAASTLPSSGSRKFFPPTHGAHVSKAGRGHNALALAAPAGIVGEDSAVGPRAPPLLLKAFNVPLPLPPCALLFPEGHSRCNLRYDWSAALNSGSEMTPSPSRSTARIISSRV